MSTQNRWIARTLLAALAASSLWAAPALAQHDGHDGHSHGEVKKAATFAEATRRISDLAAAVDASLKVGNMGAVADGANAITELARQLGALALAKESGIPREKVREANLAGKALAEAADRLHNLSDTGAPDAVRAEFAALRAQLAKVDALAPATFFCPMHCEGDKTYPAPGKCPICSMNLKKQTSEKFTVDIVPAAPLKAGVATTLTFTLRDPRGLPVTGVEIVHEQPLHLLMVSRDLSWYAHEHPVLQPDGTFTFEWAFPAPGEYTLFNDFTPKDVGMQVVPVTLSVPGAAPATVKLTVDDSKPKLIDGYRISLDTGGPVKTGATTHLAYTVEKDGKPVTDLEPYLGAMGHLVIISEDLKEFVHSHPHEEGAGHDHDAGHDHAAARIINDQCPVSGSAVNAEGPTREWKGHTVGFCCGSCGNKWDAKPAGDKDAFVSKYIPAGSAGHTATGPRVDFEASFKAPGLYKGWAQFQHNGKIITAPFTFSVARGEAGAETGHGHDHK